MRRGTQTQFVYATNQDHSVTAEYYPSEYGWDVADAACLTLQGYLAGGVTWTIEATMSKRDNTAPAVWDDVSKMFVDQNDQSDGTASWTDDASLLLQLNGLNYERIRVKETTSDATNERRGWARFV